ncbi:hypothetical protein IE81DRAFT_368712 [Ceraceosorus guamensis]|uniref:DNA mismatch repair proteins mutS family domain-containing protein n=1 Tax=Ceraceosorus guamensis TaxID=1522189 RepID=A0A316VQU1_9BASI|nr:hypothetical protein IE81DRAFT_368712 [Ceraceosorus guamensis]PWN39892.1 hypothetical protein IE81DRAFT_368712 [Ceraceosorus guamensis]
MACRLSSTQLCSEKMAVLAPMLTLPSFALTCSPLLARSQRFAGARPRSASTLSTQSGSTTHSRAPHLSAQSASDQTVSSSHHAHNPSPEERFSVDAESEVEPVPTLALFTSKHQVGAAFFDAPQRALLLLQDTAEAGLEVDYGCTAPFDALEDNSMDSTGGSSRSVDAPQEKMVDTTSLLVEQLRPQRVLVAPSCSVTCMDTLKAALREQGGTLELVDKKNFNFNAGKSRLAGLSLPLIESTGSAVTQLHDSAISLRLSSMINVDHMTLSIMAAEALLKHLSSESFSAGGDLDDRVPVTSIELLSLDHCLSIDGDSRLALSVFQEEQHATLHSDRGKEGLSLFSLLNQTKTANGHHVLRRWLMLPSCDLNLLSMRHDAVECLSMSRNVEAVASISRALRSVKAVPKLVLRLRKGTAAVQHFRSVVKYCKALLEVQDSLRSLEAAASVHVILKADTAIDARVLKRVINNVESIIDWEESATERRCCVNRGIDDQLDEWKDQFQSLPRLLSQVATQLRDDSPPVLGSRLSVVYFPQMGYLVALSTADGDAVDLPAVAASVGWLFEFTSEIASYWRNETTEELNAHVGDISTFIVDREIELVHQLQEDISSHAALLVHAHTVCCELDCLMSLAACASLYGYVRPTLDTSLVLDIQDGRHPLQELCVETFVPNDIAIVGGLGEGANDTEDDHSLVVLTGANAGGKSVYLKQNAVIVILAQIGSFVPASSAHIGLVDKILTRVQARESVGRHVSSFTADMLQVSRVLRQATAKSLVLLDEMGKGTVAADGAALFAATCWELLSRGSECPRSLAITHFHDVFAKNLLPTTLPFRKACMQTMSAEGQEGGNVTFLYKVASGEALDSQVASCARAAGLPPRLVDRARYVAELAAASDLDRLLLDEEELLEAHDDASVSSLTSSARGKFPAAALREGMVKRRAEADRAEEIARKFLEWDLEAECAASKKEDVDRTRVLSRLSTILGERNAE